MKTKNYGKHDIAFLKSLNKKFGLKSVEIDTDVVYSNPNILKEIDKLPDKMESQYDHLFLMGLSAELL